MRQNKNMKELFSICLFLDISYAVGILTHKEFYVDCSICAHVL